MSKTDDRADEAIRESNARLHRRIRMRWRYCPDPNCREPIRAGATCCPVHGAGDGRRRGNAFVPYGK